MRATFFFRCTALSSWHLATASCCAAALTSTSQWSLYRCPVSATSDRPPFDIAANRDLLAHVCASVLVAESRHLACEQMQPSGVSHGFTDPLAGCGVDLAAPCERTGVSRIVDLSWSFHSGCEGFPVICAGGVRHQLTGRTSVLSWDRFQFHHKYGTIVAFMGRSLAGVSMSHAVATRVAWRITGGAHWRWVLENMSCI